MHQFDEPNEEGEDNNSSLPNGSSVRLWGERGEGGEM